MRAVARLTDLMPVETADLRDRCAFAATARLSRERSGAEVAAEDVGGGVERHLIDLDGVAGVG
jgi:hypothetical protein